MPCSGRTLPVPHFYRMLASAASHSTHHGQRTGPPIAPSNMASAFFAALSASFVSGSPVASIEAFDICQLWCAMRREPISTYASK